MQCRTWSIVFSCVAAIPVAARAIDDSVADDLSQTRQQFETAVEEVREKVRAEFSKAEAAARKRGDTKLLTTLAEEQAAFEKRGRMPHRVRPARYERLLRPVRLRMKASYEDAIQESTKAGDVDRTKALQGELALFLTGAGQPITPLDEVRAAFTAITTAEYFDGRRQQLIESKLDSLIRDGGAKMIVRGAGKQYFAARKLVVAAAARDRGEDAESALATMLQALQVVYRENRVTGMKLGLDDLFEKLEASH